MILKRIISPNTVHKVKQFELLSKTNLFASSCKLPTFGRTTATFTTAKHCFNNNILGNGCTHVGKFPTTAALGTQIVRKATTTTGDHVRLWVFEKIVSAALPIVIPVALITENSILDGVMSALIVMHTHWGLEAIITDYARPSVVGTALPKVLHLSLIILSAVTLAGLFILINNGPGVSKAVKDFWAIGKKPAPGATV